MGLITVVIMTRDRVQELLATLQRLHADGDPPPIVVVDNGSSDGTVREVRARFPEVTVVPLGRNLGVAARNIAVRSVETPYVAFNDDDSWWEPSSLRRATQVLERYPTLGVVSAHVVVEPGGRDDPVSLEMADSPLPGDPDVPGVPVLGFLACAAAVRRRAFIEVGGFNERLHFSGEEALLATDLAAAGWEVRYIEDLVVHHRPSGSRDHRWRRRREVRNRLWFLWLRRPVRSALRRSYRLLRSADRRAAVSGGLDALKGLPWLLRERRVVPAEIERQLALLDDGRYRTEARQHVA